MSGQTDAEYLAMVGWIIGSRVAIEEILGDSEMTDAEKAAAIRDVILLAGAPSGGGGGSEGGGGGG